MGSIRPITNHRITCTIPKNFVLTLKDKCNIKTFIETGTYSGDTSSWAADHFEKVITIEASEKYYNESLDRFKKESKNNIDLYKGISYEILEKIGYKYFHDDSLIFWLDSHWSSGETFGDTIGHPLLKELEVILNSTCENFFFIDDLSCISHPCKVGYADEWPLLGDIFKVFNGKRTYIDYNFSILGDCIFIFPNKNHVKILLNEFRESEYMNYL